MSFVKQCTHTDPVLDRTYTYSGKILLRCKITFYFTGKNPIHYKIPADFSNSLLYFTSRTLVVN